MIQDDQIEIYLSPGEFAWGDALFVLKTVLGSCVAICMWHPKLKIGGMSHSVLPYPPASEQKSGLLNARYVAHSIEFFNLEVYKSKTNPKDYIVKVFGGSKIFLSAQEFEVGQRNVALAKELLSQNGFVLYSEHTGGKNSRNIIFNLADGKTWLRNLEVQHGNH